MRKEKYDEAFIKEALTRKMRESPLLRGHVVIRLENRMGAGYPDILDVGGGYTTFLECKHVGPKDSDIRTRGIQELTMKRLWKASGSRAYYVIWHEDSESGLFTHIVSPVEVNEWRILGKVCSGFNHDFVIQFLQDQH